MKQTAWAHLPNAKHINWVLASIKAHPEKWKAAWEAAYYAAKAAAWAAARDAAKDAAYDVTREAARDELRVIVYNTARNIVPEPATAYYAWTAIVALIAWDDCAYMIESEVDEIKILAKLGDQKAILLLPACIVFNETREVV